MTSRACTILPPKAWPIAWCRADAEDGQLAANASIAATDAGLSVGVQGPGEITTVPAAISAMPATSISSLRTTCTSAPSSPGVLRVERRTSRSCRSQQHFGINALTFGKDSTVDRRQPARVLRGEHGCA